MPPGKKEIHCIVSALALLARATVTPHLHILVYGREGAPPNTMKKLVITLILLPFFLISSQSLADARAAVARQKKAGPNVSKNAAFLCAAILSTAAASATLANKLTNTPNGHNPGWALRVRAYRDKHALAIFLGRGLGKKFAREELATHEDEIEIVEEFVAEPVNVDVEKVLASISEEALNRSIFFTEHNINGHYRGYIVLPGLVSTFEINANELEPTFSFKLVGVGTLLAKGKIRFKAVSEIHQPAHL